MMHSDVGFSLLVLVSTLQTGRSLKCYSCFESYPTELKCDSGLGRGVNCSGDPSPLARLSHVQRGYKCFVIGYKGGKHMILDRGCIYTTDDYCSVMLSYEHVSMCETCHTDFCNSAGRSPARSTILFLAALTALPFYIVR